MSICGVRGWQYFAPTKDSNGHGSNAIQMPNTITQIQISVKTALLRRSRGKVADTKVNFHPWSCHCLHNGHVSHAYCSFKLQNLWLTGPKVWQGASLLQWSKDATQRLMAKNVDYTILKGGVKEVTRPLGHSTIWNGQTVPKLNKPNFFCAPPFNPIFPDDVFTWHETACA